MIFEFLHNLNFYQAIIKSIEYSFSYGFFPTYISGVANEGLGSFSALATPHIMLYIPALMYHYSKNISWSINTFLAILNFLQFLFMFICLAGITKKKLASFFASLIYVSIYIFTLNTFVRYGLSEHIAITFIPLVIYGFYSIYFEESKYRVLLLVGLFFIALSNVTIFIFTLLFVVLFAVIFFLRSIFLMKILRIVFAFISLILLIAFKYVPMVHYYFLKQYSIVDIIGNMKIIITTFLFSFIPFIYVLLSKKIIRKIENKGAKIFISILSIIMIIGSISLYNYFYYYTDKLDIGNDMVCVDNTYIPKYDSANVKKDFDKENLKNIYSDNNNFYNDIKVANYTRNYLRMNIEYEKNVRVDVAYLDIPLYNMIGFKAYDDKNNQIPIIYGDGNLCRVELKDNNGVVRIGFVPPTMWTVALCVSVVWFFILIILSVFREIRTLKKFLKDDKIAKMSENIEENKKLQDNSEKAENISENKGSDSDDYDKLSCKYKNYIV